MAVIYAGGAQISTTDERAAQLVAELESMEPGGVIFIHEPGVFARVPYNAAVTIVLDIADPLMRDDLAR
jgi:hypothetical protein